MRKRKKHFILQLAKAAQLLLVAVALMLPETAFAAVDADVEGEL